MKRIVKHNDLITVAFCMCITAFFSFFLLGNKNFALDEIATVLITKDWSSMLHFIKMYEGNMWLYYFLLHALLFLGQSEFSIRILSALFAIATVPVVFLISKTLFNTTVSRITTLIFSTQIFLILSAQNARSYSMELFLTTLSSYFFIKYVCDSSKKYLLVWTLINILAIYTHLYAVLVIAAQIISLAFIIRKIHWKEVFVTIPLYIIGVLPLILMPSIHSGQINWIPIPTLKSLLGTLLILSDDFPPTAVMYLGLLAFYLFAIWKNKQRLFTSNMWSYGFLFTWMLFPIVAAFIFSLFIKPIYTSTYFIICLVPFTILIGLSLQTIQKKWLRNTLILFLIFFSLIRLTSWYTGNKHIQFVILNNNEDWKKTAQFLSAHVQSHDAILFFPPYLQEGVNYYYDKQKTVPYVEEINLQPDPLMGGSVSIPFNEKLLRTIPQKYSHVWYVSGDFTDIQRNEQKISVEKTLKDNYMLKQKKAFEYLTVYEYQKFIFLTK